MSALTTEQANAARRWGFFTVERDFMAHVEQVFGGQAVLMLFFLMQDARFEDGTQRLQSGGVASLRVGDAIFSRRGMAKRMGCREDEVRRLADKLYEAGVIVRLDPSERIVGKSSRRPPTLVHLPFYLGGPRKCTTQKKQQTSRQRRRAPREKNIETPQVRLEASLK